LEIKIRSGRTIFETFDPGIVRFPTLRRNLSGSLTDFDSHLIICVLRKAEGFIEFPLEDDQDGECGRCAWLSIGSLLWR
jgi:hypothetical protein